MRYSQQKAKSRERIYLEDILNGQHKLIVWPGEEESTAVKCRLHMICVKT
jgi:hypothetical protein